MSDIIINIIKFIAFVLLLPFVYAAYINFNLHLTVYPSIYADFFQWGMAAYLLCYVFIFRFQEIHVAGQKIILSLFSSVSPLDRLFANLFPFYLTCILIVFYITKQFLNISTYEHYFIFFSGYALAMHILLTAQNSRDQDSVSFKPTYFLVIALTVIFNILLVVFGLDAIVGEFTILAFIKSIFHDAGKCFEVIYNIIV